MLSVFLLLLLGVPTLGVKETEDRAGGVCTVEEFAPSVLCLPLFPVEPDVPTVKLQVASIGKTPEAAADGWVGCDIALGDVETSGSV